MTYIIVQDVGMHHADKVRYMVIGLQEFLKQEPAPIKSPVDMQETQVYHV